MTGELCLLTILTATEKEKIGERERRRRRKRHNNLLNFSNWPQNLSLALHHTKGFVIVLPRPSFGCFCQNVVVTTEIGLATREHQSFSPPKKIGRSSNSRTLQQFFLGRAKQASLLISSPSACLRNVMIRTTLFLTHSKRTLGVISKRISLEKKKKKNSLPRINKLSAVLQSSAIVEPDIKILRI